MSGFMDTVSRMARESAEQQDREPDNLDELRSALWLQARVRAAKDLLAQVGSLRGPANESLGKAWHALSDLERALGADVEAHSTDIRAGVVE